MHIAFFDFVTQYGGAPRVTIELAGRLAEHTRVSVIDPYGYCHQFREAAAQTKIDFHVLDPKAGSVVIGHRGLGRALRVIRSAGGLRRIQARLTRLLRRIEASVVCSSSPKGLYLIGTSLRLRKLPMVAFTQGWCLPELMPAYSPQPGRRHSRARPGTWQRCWRPRGVTVYKPKSPWLSGS